MTPVSSLIYTVVVVVSSGSSVAEYIWVSIGLERTGHIINSMFGHSSHTLFITPQCECQYFYAGFSNDITFGCVYGWAGGGGGGGLLNRFVRWFCRLPIMVVVRQIIFKE